MHFLTGFNRFIPSFSAASNIAATQQPSSSSNQVQQIKHSPQLQSQTKAVTSAERNLSAMPGMSAIPQCVRNGFTNTVNFAKRHPIMMTAGAVATLAIGGALGAAVYVYGADEVINTVTVDLPNSLPSIPSWNDASTAISDKWTPWRATAMSYIDSACTKILSNAQTCPANTPPAITAEACSGFAQKALETCPKQVPIIKEIVTVAFNGVQQIPQSILKTCDLSRTVGNCAAVMDLINGGAASVASGDLSRLASDFVQL